MSPTADGPVSRHVCAGQRSHGSFSETRPAAPARRSASRHGRVQAFARPIAHAVGSGALREDALLAALVEASGQQTTDSNVPRCPAPARTAWCAVVLRELWRERNGSGDSPPAWETGRRDRGSDLHIGTVDAVSLTRLLGPQWRALLAVARAEDCPDDPMAEDINVVERWTSLKWICSVETVDRAAIESGRHDQLRAARRITRHIGVGVHQRAASDAATALVVGDVVGVHGLGAHHFEFLIAPWLCAHPEQRPNCEGLTAQRTRV